MEKKKPAADKADVFAYGDYHDYLQYRLTDRPGQGWGSITRIAEAIRCQRSHISRVLNGQKELTPEQALSLTHYWGLDDSAAEYFILLVDLARAGTPELRERLLQRLNQIKQAQQNLSQRLGHEQLAKGEREALYYSAWYWSAIHIATSIGDLQTPERISEKLHLPRVLVTKCLEKLQTFGLVRKERGKWMFATAASFHVPKHSPLNAIHQQNWRQRAVIDINVGSDESVHYSVVQSISRKDFEVIKDQLLRSIDRYNQTAAPSKPEDLVAFTCDFYKV